MASKGVNVDGISFGVVEKKPQQKRAPADIPTVCKKLTKLVVCGLVNVPSRMIPVTNV